jgi:hypothetical protein
MVALAARPCCSDVCLEEPQASPWPQPQTALGSGRARTVSADPSPVNVLVPPSSPKDGLPQLQNGFVGLRLWSSQVPRARPFR